MTRPADPDLAAARRPVRHYDCCLCQRSHSEFDPEFGPHHARQSRHGTYALPASAGQVFRRLVEVGE